MNKINLQSNVRKSLIYFSGLFGFIATILVCMFDLYACEENKDDKAHMFICVALLVVQAILNVIILFTSLFASVSLALIISQIIFALIFIVLGFVFLLIKDVGKETEKLKSKFNRSNKQDKDDKNEDNEEEKTEEEIIIED